MNSKNDLAKAATWMRRHRWHLKWYFHIRMWYIIYTVFMHVIYTHFFNSPWYQFEAFIANFYEHKHLGHKIWGRQEAVVSREVKEAQAAAASALRKACEGKNAQQEICFLFVSVALVASRCVGLFFVGGVVEWDQITKSRGACANALNGGQDVRCWFRMMVWPIWCLCRPPSLKHGPNNLHPVDSCWFLLMQLMPGIVH